MRISIIAAVSKNGVIGNKGTIPWKLRGDMLHFKNTTRGHAVVMGRKTFESMGSKPLSGRHNIVVSRTMQRGGQGYTCCGSLSEALSLAEGLGAEECFIIGGSELYREGLTIADRLIITTVFAEVEGDTFFPQYNEKRWQAESYFMLPAGEDNEHPYALGFYERIVEELEATDW